MKEFILQNFKKYPIPVIAVVLLYLYINELSANREDYRNCQEDIKRKDIALAASAERERRMNETLMEFAFEIRMNKEKEKNADSVIKSETQSNVKKLLNR